MITKLLHKLIHQDDFILTPEHRSCLDLLENSTQNLLLTGKAGTGKSSLIKYFRNKTKKKVVILAPTGIAALNCQGQTIHSFFGFPPRLINLKAIYKRKNTRLYKNIDTLIIDEISMVRADLLDGVDKFLRLNGKDQSLPFGGVQMVFVGDLYQLPPVVTNEENSVFGLYYDSPYFFSANSFNRDYFEIIELQTIFRQKEEDFVRFLNTVRSGQSSLDSLEYINSRLTSSEIKDSHIILCSINNTAQNINLSRLEKINKPLFTYQGIVEGDFPTEDRTLPVDLNLNLKVGAKVIFVKNDKGKRWVNGTMGTIHKLSKDEMRALRAENSETTLSYSPKPRTESPKNDIHYHSDLMGLSGTGVKVKIEDSNLIVNVLPETWDNIRYEYDEEKGEIVEKVIGTLTQYPLRLAWALTIHKSQGMTFDRVCLDFRRSPFTHGQTYVALSRCRSLGGLLLTQKIYPNDIILDDRIVDFHKKIS